MKQFEPKTKQFHTLLNSISQKKYNTALRQACTANNTLTKQVINLLLKFGSQIMLSPSEKNSSGKSAIDLAIENNNLDFNQQLENYINPMSAYSSRINIQAS